MIAFGPIPSRRLGKSLGINNIASHKVCSYGCVYCQIGRTNCKSNVRTSFYEPEKLVEDVKNHLKKLDKDHTPDYLTIVPNGEPTLDINLGTEIRLLKALGFPVAVISNASQICDNNVRDDLMEADWVSVKVDSADEIVWRKINNPFASIDFDKMLEGLQTFARSFSGRLHTETMLVRDCNDAPGLLTNNASFIASLKPRMAYLSIPIRPPAVKGIMPVTEETLTRAWHIYQDAGIETELLTGFEGTDTGSTGNAFEDILNITAVHPLREDTLMRLLKQDHSDHTVVDSLVAQGLIKAVKHNGKLFYVRNYHM